MEEVVVLAGEVTIPYSVVHTIRQKLTLILAASDTSLGQYAMIIARNVKDIDNLLPRNQTYPFIVRDGFPAKLP